MEREIKFRVLYRGEMHKVREITMYTDGDIGIAIVWGDDRNYIYPNSEHVSELMQYTGTTDRNDNEIYEGDILKCNLWGDKLNGTAIVKYDAPTFYLDYFHNEENFPQDFADKFWKFDKIGNIHQNPDLL